MKILIVSSFLFSMIFCNLNSVMAFNVFQDFKNSSITFDTLNPETFVFQVVNFSNEIIRRGRINNPSQVLSDADLTAIIHQFNFNSINDFNAYFQNSFEVISANLSSNGSINPLPTLPCFEALRADLLACPKVGVGAGLIGGYEGGIYGAIGGGLISAILCVSTAYDKFEACLRGTYK